MSAANVFRKRLILLEFNELCPSFVEQFIDEGLLPNFKRLRDASERFITHASDSMLEPWIQWVTVHTGVPLLEHGIVDLDEADKLRHEAFWETLTDESVLLLSPMNVKFKNRGDSVFLPDPWAASQSPSDELKPLANFIRSAVTSHARTDKLDATDALGAVLFLVSHGLSFESVRAAFKQLSSERFGSHATKWRRATVLDRLLWDVFSHYWKKISPRIGVFFSNATAHYQHKYWSHHDPSGFSIKPDQAEILDYGNAIRFGYQAHDRLIGKALALAGTDAVVAMCTALSQQPMHDYEVRGGKAMFIPKSYADLLRFLGAPPGRAEALMAEESWLRFRGEDEARDAHAKVRAARTEAGQPVFKTRGLERSSFIIGCGLFASEVKADTLMFSGDERRAQFDEFFLPMPTVTTGKHHPDGLLWIADRRAQPSSGDTQLLPLTLVRSKLEQALT
jgi:hypothetical protein